MSGVVLSVGSQLLCSLSWQRYEDQLASQESVRALLQAGEAVGEEYSPWQQSRRTLWYNVGEIETEMYSGSVTGEQYYARLTTVMQSDLFPDWGELGMRRWCLQGGFSVCKVNIPQSRNCRSTKTVFPGDCADGPVDYAVGGGAGRGAVLGQV